MPRHLIIRPSAIGDIVFATPLAAALRRGDPQVYIAWLVEPQLEELLAGDRCIDRLIAWPKAEWLQLWRSGRRAELGRRIAAFRAALRAQRFDVALDLQGLFKSGVLAWWSGAPRRIGLGSREGSRWLMSEVVPRGGEVARIGSEYRFLARHLGLDGGAFLPRLVLQPAAERAALDLLAARGLTPGRYMVFAPFTTRPQKHWPEAHWRALAPRLAAASGLAPVLLGGPGDGAAAARIAQGAGDIVNLAGRTRLAEAMALVRHAGLLVGVDTGLTHMGAAFATPTVALFGSTCPYRDAGRANFRVLWLGLACSPCRRRPTCGGAFPCLREISAERVTAEALAALAQPCPELAA